MAGSVAARRYARALFAIADEAQCAPALHEELRGLCALLARHDALRRALLQPLYPAAQRRAVFTAVAERSGASALFKNFCAFLIDRRRLLDLALIEAEYARLLEAAAGRTRATLRTPAPLDAAREERVRAALSARAGRPVQLEVVVDETLLGGVVAQVGDTVFDGSLRAGLARLRAGLARRDAPPAEGGGVTVTGGDGGGDGAARVTVTDGAGASTLLNSGEAQVGRGWLRRRCAHAALFGGMEELGWGVDGVSVYRSVCTNGVLTRGLVTGDGRDDGAGGDGDESDGDGGIVTVTVGSLAWKT